MEGSILLLGPHSDSGQSLYSAVFTFSRNWSKLATREGTWDFSYFLSRDSRRGSVFFFNFSTRDLQTREINSRNLFARREPISRVCTAVSVSARSETF